MRVIFAIMDDDCDHDDDDEVDFIVPIGSNW